MLRAVDSRSPATAEQANDNHAIYKRRMKQSLALTAALLTIAAPSIYVMTKCQLQDNNYALNFWEIINPQNPQSAVGYLKSTFNPSTDFMTNFTQSLIKTAGYILLPIDQSKVPTDVTQKVGSLLKTSTCNTLDFLTNLEGESFTKIRSAFSAVGGYARSENYFDSIVSIAILSTLGALFSAGMAGAFYTQVGFWKNESARLNGDHEATVALLPKVDDANGDIELTVVVVNEEEGHFFPSTAGEHALTSPTTPTTPTNGWVI
ncbi:MAG: hypothetical protein P1U34_00285 [Coxiellaceae bacterium]|nr:hypothetical protein [Coxiellaceae bacterium]